MVKTNRACGLYEWETGVMGDKMGLKRGLQKDPTKWAACVCRRESKSVLREEKEGRVEGINLVVFTSPKGTLPKHIFPVLRFVSDTQGALLNQTCVKLDSDRDNVQFRQVGSTLKGVIVGRPYALTMGTPVEWAMGEQTFCVVYASCLDHLLESETFS